VEWILIETAPISGDVLGEEMFQAEEGVLRVGGSGPSLDAAVPSLEALATDSALDLDAMPKFL
jgi:hypothetical protein